MPEQMPERQGIQVRDLRADEYPLAHDFAARQGRAIPDSNTMRTIAVAEDEAATLRGVQVFDWSSQGFEVVTRIINASSPEQQTEIIEKFTGRIAVIRACCGFDDA